MSKEQDQIFFRNFSLAIGAIAVMMVIFFVIAQYAGSNDEADANKHAAKVAEVTKPVGQVATTVGEDAEKVVKAAEDSVAEAPATESPAAETSAAETGSDVGQTVYKGLCFNCHGVAAMATMIPQTGDAAAWASRIEQGIETLYDHAINGFTGKMGMMPAKGSNPGLSDDEVKAAVDYIVSQSQ